MCVLLFGDVISCECLLIPAINLLHHLRPQELRWELRWSWEIWKSLKQTSLWPALAANKHMCAPQEQSPGFPQPSFSPVRLSTSRKGHNTHTSRARAGVPSLQHSLLSPQGRCLFVYFFLFHCRIPGPNLIAFLPFLPYYMYNVLTLWLVQESFCHFPVSF